MAVPHFKAKEEDMYMKEVNKAFDHVPSLSIKVVVLTEDKVNHLQEHIVHTVLRIAVQYCYERKFSFLTLQTCVFLMTRS
jgi:DNA-directed RNA polymerase subunit M/transcription elongation factor TFIIS